MQRLDRLVRQCSARSRPVAVLSALLLVLSPPLAARAAAPVEVAQPSFLDSVEIRSPDLSAFHKWRDAMTRAAAESEQAVDGTCPSARSRGCVYHDWLELLAELRNAGRWQQLVRINHEMNKRRYIADQANYGVEDYWASPGEFLAREGDCEDYAITKYLSLKRLGWTDSELRLVAVRDLELNIGHAVLIVSYDGKSWLLDNQIRQIMDTRDVRHYRPVYSINETAWWRHQPPAGLAAADGNAAATAGAGADR